MSFYPHRFETQVEPVDWNGTRYTIVRLPPEPVPDLPLARHPRLRVEGEVGEMAMVWTWNPTPAALGTGWFACLSKEKLRERDLVADDTVQIAFSVADQEAVEVPHELAHALQGDAAARIGWDALTPGRRRAPAHTVKQAKRQETHDRRSATIVATLARGDDPFPPRARHGKATP